MEQGKQVFANLTDFSCPNQSGDPCQERRWVVTDLCGERLNTRSCKTELLPSFRDQILVLASGSFERELCLARVGTDLLGWLNTL